MSCEAFLASIRLCESPFDGHENSLITFYRYDPACVFLHTSSIKLTLAHVTQTGTAAALQADNIR